MKTASIHQDWRGNIVAIDDESAQTIETVSRYCNPAAIRQLILATELAGYNIDWDESTVCNPDEPTA